MKLVLLWVAALAGVVLCWPRATRSSAYLLLAGTAFGLMVHYDIATVPGARNTAILLWLAAAILFADNAKVALRKRAA